MRVFPVLAMLAAAVALAGPPPVPGAAAPAPGPAATQATPPSPAASGAEAAGLLRAFFAEEDSTKRASMAAKFADSAPRSLSDLKTMLHAAAPRPPLPAGRQRFETQASGAIPPIRYLLRVPKRYAAETSRGWPLIVSSLHRLSGGAEPMMDILQEWMGPDIENFLVACADPPTDGPYEVNEVNTLYPLNVLDDVRRRVNVDSDRIVLMGLLKSGYLVWATALFSPGEWAAMVTVSSRPITEAGSFGCTLYMPNVLNLPIQAHWGEQHFDAGKTEGNVTWSREAAAALKRLGAAKFEGIEYPGEARVQHVQTDRVRALAASARRDAFPAACRLVFHHLYQGRACYVRATAVGKDEFDFRARHPFQVTPGEDPHQALQNLFVREGYELTARMAPGANSISVMARNLKAIEIELAAEKLDFGRPVQITVNGRIVSNVAGKLDYGELLETARRTGDFERLVAGRLKVNVLTGKAM